MKRILLALLLGTTTLGTTTMGEELNEDQLRVRGSALDILKHRLGISDGVEVKQMANVTWPNGAMGCPKPGMAYTQALIPGYRIVLEAEGRTYHYHAREHGEPFFCAHPEPQASWIMDR